MPPAKSLLFDASNHKPPAIGALAAVANLSHWHDLHAELISIDSYNDDNKVNGMSDVRNREASRLVAVSQPFADGWITVLPDGTRTAAVDSADFVISAQRRLGLHLSMAKQTLDALKTNGQLVDFFGDDASNKACQNRRHRAALDAWARASRAVAHGPVVQGDKDNENLTKQYNDGHVSDLVEVGAGLGGRDRIKEIKVFSPLKKAHAAGRGSTTNGGCPASAGHEYAFGNTEEAARLENLGCKERGRQVDGPLDHKTGKGWVKQRDGCYRDALLNKKNTVEVILHETLGGGFSPPAVAALHANSKIARAGVDSSKYTCPRPISYITHHSQHISLGIVKADASAIRGEIGKRKAELTNYMGAMGARM